MAVARDLRTMRDEKLYADLGYETFEGYAESAVGIKRRQAYKFISALGVLESVGSVQSTAQLGIEKLAAIASLPDPDREEFIAEPQPIPSTGETKRVEDMTTRELAEAVKARKAAEQRAADLARQNQQLELRLKEAKQRQPETVEVYKVPEEVQQALQAAQAELDELRKRKSLTSEFQQRKAQLETEIADLIEAKRKLAESHNEQQRRASAASEFVAKFRRAAKPLKEAKGELEQLAQSGVIHWSWVRDLEADLKVLYEVLDLVDDAIKTVDVTNITTEGEVVNG